MFYALHSAHSLHIQVSVAVQYKKHSAFIIILQSRNKKDSRSRVFFILFSFLFRSDLTTIQQSTKNSTELSVCFEWLCMKLHTSFSTSSAEFIIDFVGNA